MDKQKQEESQLRRSKSPHSTSMIELWCLRVLVLCGGYRKFVEKDGFSSDEVLAVLGLEEYAEQEIDRPAFIKLLKQKHLRMEKAHVTYPETLVNNLSHILDRIPLNKVETDILVFAIMLQTEIALEECTETLGNLDKAKLMRALSTTLDFPLRDVTAALAFNGRLAMSGLLKIDMAWPRQMSSKIDLMSGLAENLLAPGTDSSKLFANSFVEGQDPKLGGKDFEHVKGPYALIRCYLEQALQKTKGVNFLIYGLPGSGKTEMVRSVVHEAKAQLYEISMEDAEGDPLSSKARFSAYQLSQEILNRTLRAVIMFDEIEDVFPESSDSNKPKPGNTEKKAWINRLLESNQVPAFWLSNKVRQIDPAFLRRFDYVLKMPKPTSRMRKQMFTRYLGNLPVSEEWLVKMSSNREILPAHIEKAAKVAVHVADKDAKKIEAVLESVLDGTLEILDARKAYNAPPAMATSYSLEYVSANVDVSGLVKGLARSRKGNICFYGPPGTGKTALGQYIAVHLDMPLIVKRASDLLNMWVGGTEKNIAEMFHEARDENGVLLLDEADSFLRDRRGADHSWEVTQVNELLVQMENFDGLFICSTNLMDDLDQASLRRFAIKVQFDYLKPDQAWKMLQKECIGKATDKDRWAIIALQNLAPGDFAAVKKRLAILGVKPTPNALIVGLREESTLKQDGAAGSIGFIQ